MTFEILFIFERLEGKNTMISQFKQMHLISKVAMLLSLLVLTLSLTQDTYFVDGSNGSEGKGLEILFVGGFSFLGGAALAFLIWCANPIYFTAIYFSLSNTENKIWGGIMIIVAFVLSAVLFFVQRMPINEAGSTAKVVGLGWGYKLWVISMFLMMISLVIDWRRSSTKIIT